MTTALSLKYRPQKLAELDHKSARQSLLKIFESGKIPPAFLFSGPKGIGKTSAARIVAKAVNCEKTLRPTRGKEFEPCGECSACLSITNGTNLDVLEIDAASNRGIDDIRELKDKIRLAPTSASFKVYIIDEVHMLTNEAFNALLKTLEEPPAHAMFVLCTTAPEKLPETIVSRCTRINFRKATKEEIVEKLQKITKAEGFQFKEEDFGKIAKAAGGSFRDAVKLLEQSASSTVDEVLGTYGGAKAIELAVLLSGRETRQAIIWVNNAVEQGLNLRILVEGVLEIFREALLKSFGVVTEEKTMAEEVKNLTTEELKILIKLFSQAVTELKSAVIPQLPLEMAIIEWGTMDEQGTMNGEQRDGGGGEETKKINLQPENQANEAIPGKIKDEQRAKGSTPPVVHGSVFKVQLTEVLSKWPEILEKVKLLNHSLQAFLKACRPVEIEGGFLTLEVFYKFHKDQLESEGRRQMVEEVCGQVLSLPVKLKLILGDRTRKPVEIDQEKPVPSVGVLEQNSAVKAEDNGNLIDEAIKIFGEGAQLV
jgi:DNA polymerase-3 subunit gamma/tau